MKSNTSKYGKYLPKGVRFAQNKKLYQQWYRTKVRLEKLIDIQKPVMLERNGDIAPLRDLFIHIQPMAIISRLTNKIEMGEMERLNELSMKRLGKKLYTSKEEFAKAEFEAILQTSVEEINRSLVSYQYVTKTPKGGERLSKHHKLIAQVHGFTRTLKKYIYKPGFTIEEMEDAHVLQRGLGRIYSAMLDPSRGTTKEDWDRFADKAQKLITNPALFEEIRNRNRKNPIKELFDFFKVEE